MSLRGARWLARGGDEVPHMRDRMSNIRVCLATKAAIYPFEMT
jgi:hypothetical protein